MIHKALWPDPGAQAGMSPPSPDNLWCQMQLGALGKGSYRSLQSPDRIPEVPMLPKPSQDGMRQLQRHKTATKCSKENSLTPAKNLGEKRRETQRFCCSLERGSSKAAEMLQHARGGARRGLMQVEFSSTEALPET